MPENFPLHLCKDVYATQGWIAVNYTAVTLGSGANSSEILLQENCQRAVVYLWLGLDGGGYRLYVAALNRQVALKRIGS